MATASALSELYDKITTQLIAMGTIKWFDVDMGQLENEKLPLKYPAVLIKIGDVIWKDNAESPQIGTVTLAIKIVFRFELEHDFLKVEAGGRKEVRTNLDFVKSVHENLITVTGSSFNTLRRFNQYHLEVKSKELLWVQVLQYQCNIKSDDTSPDAALSLDYDNVKNNNSFLERRKMNLTHQ